MVEKCNIFLTAKLPDFSTWKDENFLFDFGQRTHGLTDAEQILLEHIDTLTLEDDLHDLYCNELKNNAVQWVDLALNAIKQGHYTAAKNEIIKHIQDLDEVSLSTVSRNLSRIEF